MSAFDAFDVLSFDCYGTLIDWESGLWRALRPLAEAASRPLDRETALSEFARHETAQQHATPGQVYRDLLATVHRKLAAAWQVDAEERDHHRFADSIDRWEPFPDSAAALERLGHRFELVILSNVDRRSFTSSARKLGADFAAVHTAEEIGSYKPNPRNFEAMIEALRERGGDPERLLHVAQSVHHDLVPAVALGLKVCWVDRRAGREGWGATAPPREMPPVDFRVESLAELADLASG